MEEEQKYEEITTNQEQDDRKDEKSDSSESIPIKEEKSLEDTSVDKEKIEGVQEEEEIDKESEVTTDVRIVEVKRILSCNCYYDMLQLNLTDNQASIKTAYKRITRIVHPDKALGIPGTEDAFKLVSTAYSVLSSESSKKLYDACVIESRKTPEEKLREQRAELAKIMLIGSLNDLPFPFLYLLLNFIIKGQLSKTVNEFLVKNSFS